jgi:hypothetical protein
VAGALAPAMVQITYCCAQATELNAINKLRIFPDSNICIPLETGVILEPMLGGEIDAYAARLPLEHILASPVFCLGGIENNCL